MIAKPPIDDLTKIAGNKYVLCVSLAKRAKQLNEMQQKEEIPATVKTITMAADELMDGKIKIVEEK